MPNEMNKSLFVRELIAAFSKIGVTGHGAKKYIARLCGVSATAVGKWTQENSHIYPQLEHLLKISEETGVSLDRLIKGQENRLEAIKLPVLSIDDFYKYESLNFEEIFQDEVESIPAMNGVKEGFGFIMNDDSMSYEPIQPNYPVGTLLVFDTAKVEPNNNDFVFAILSLQGEKVGVFRKLIKVGGKSHLSPLNPMYNKEEGEFKILGRLSYSIRYN